MEIKISDRGIDFTLETNLKDISKEIDCNFYLECLDAESYFEEFETHADKIKPMLKKIVEDYFEGRALDKGKFVSSVLIYRSSLMRNKIFIGGIVDFEHK